ncbi:hypothetical protein GJ496_002062 [Pomphorhynchus laevis]|nr:hypothetical protein GJ496_002062 [Pomphorhynchus laevis]
MPRGRPSGRIQNAIKPSLLKAANIINNLSKLLQFTHSLKPTIIAGYFNARNDVTISDKLFSLKEYLESQNLALHAPEEKWSYESWNGRSCVDMVFSNIPIVRINIELAFVRSLIRIIS